MSSVFCLRFLRVLTVIPAILLAAHQYAAEHATPADAAEDRIRLRLQLGGKLVDYAGMALPKHLVVVRGHGDAVDSSVEISVPSHGKYSRMLFARRRFLRSFEGFCIESTRDDHFRVLRLEQVDRVLCSSLWEVHCALHAQYVRSARRRKACVATRCDDGVRVGPMLLLCPLHEVGYPAILEGVAGL